MKVNVKIKKLDKNATVPTYGSQFSAGADLYYAGSEPLTVNGGETVLVHTGVAMEIPEGLVGLVFARSGLASKRSLAPANKVGVIDSDYRGEIMVALHNHSDVSVTVEGGERIAQIAIVPFIKADFTVVDELSETVRGEGGFAFVVPGATLVDHALADENGDQIHKTAAADSRGSNAADRFKAERALF